ncbi:class IV adenylate cyclase [Treponema sp.]|uniref:class IV adenylate cyclase n=1 Tax=Treponema sp. TaxID=166 RepID=UPI0038906371
MNEIEIKARVADKKAVEDQLNSFAEFKRAVTRDDTYYIGPSGKGKKIRIRKETEDGKITWILTYKKKENKISADGTATEVNEELETTMEDSTPLVRYLEDSGYTVALTKHKDVYDWSYEEATLELCNIPPLGWFLEIEILTESNDDATVQSAQKKLKDMLLKSGLSDKDIEEKYYSQLLKEYNKNN